MPEPHCFLRYRISAATRNFTSGKSDVYVLARPTAAARRGFTMVLFTEAVSRQNTCVGGTCAPPSALLVVSGTRLYCYYYLYLHCWLTALLYLLNLMCCTFAEKCTEKADDVEVEDKPCTRCGKSNQPEWVCAVTCV